MASAIEHNTYDARTIAHYHLLAAMLARDAAAARAERARAGDVLVAAEIPADAAAQECAVCAVKDRGW